MGVFESVKGIFSAVSFDPTSLRDLSIAFIGGVACLEAYITLRQHRNHAIPKAPKAVAALVDEETFSSSQKYNRAKSSLALVSLGWAAAEGIAMIHFDVYPRLYRWAADATAGSALGGCGASMLFAAAVYAVSTVAHLPLGIASTFGVEARFGFNKTTWGTYVLDKIKAAFVTAVIGLPLVAGVDWFVRRGGQWLWLQLWGLVFAVTVTAIVLAPTLIMPLFNKYVPVPEGSLRDAVYKLAESVSYPLGELYVMDGSKRSSHSNAFLFGLGRTKRIVLFDTLEGQVGEKGIVAILAHELGHWAHSDTLRGLAVSQVHTLLFFYMFGQAISNAQLFSDFGFAGVAPAEAPIAALTIFGLLFAPVDHVFTFAANAMTRAMEYAADGYATREIGVGDDLKEALIALHRENLSSLVPDPLYSTYNHSHPTLLERLAAIDKLQSETRKRE